MGLFAYNEVDAYLSSWSVMHFLSGYIWQVVWVWATDMWAPWASLFIFTVLAMVFELLENWRVTGAPMWAWLGYDESTYSGDTASNSVSDLLVSLLGWGVVHLVTSFARTPAALGALLGTAGVLFVAFLVLYRLERQHTFGVTKTGVDKDPERPAVLLKP